ncbi:MAG: ATP-dependent RecD-like DNA helicase [Desulfobacterales bacterium]|jgi:exodeoxyribonuclease V alpha subunit|nr:ATP-dependent RecD-like DNA helicase [Desulfobacterales bacterium]
MGSKEIELSGQIERITFTNEENGYTIAKVKIHGRQDLVTIVGYLMSPTPGEMLNMKGEWVNHPKFGEQFNVTEYKTTVPATIFGIQKYLGSGLIKGLGPVIASRIVKKFGERTLDVIENDIEKLALVEGIGKKRIVMIQNAWEEQKEIRDVMLFLRSYGVGSGYATKIFKQYGNRSIAVVKDNPYRLATDIFGIGFVTADSIAKKIGFPKGSSKRIEAGILYVLNKLSDDGHVFYPYEYLVKKSRETLEVERDAIVKGIGDLAINKQIVLEDLNESIDEFKANNKSVYLAKFHLCETGIAARLKTLSASPKSIRNIDAESALQWVQKRLDIRLAENQAKAVRCALENKIMVITGGPGTGKTTIINAILKIFSELRIKILLAAPTGRAAKRMSEATGHDARTIHRLLEYSFTKGGFQKNEDKPLSCDLLILDEVSMIDTVLMYHLTKAIPTFATVVLVGDINQLPSVGAGNVLNDIIGSHVVPVVELNEIFRQARESRIIVNAHKINNGILPTFEDHVPGNDFYFIQQEDPEKVLDIILELIKERIPKRFDLDPVHDIQVLTPMHKGLVGADNLNTTLQESLNPSKTEIIRGNRNFRVNDKVMQIRNDYDKEVFNGDIGMIADIQPDENEITVTFDGRHVVYEFYELDELVLAYAVSVHKSQGSEYPAVVMPVLSQHYILLQRNLIYTAVTRGRNLVVMVGAINALAMGIQNDKTQRRFTYLRYRLR